MVPSHSGMKVWDRHDLSNLNHYEFGINATGVGVAGGGVIGVRGGEWVV